MLKINTLIRWDYRLFCFSSGNDYAPPPIIQTPVEKAPPAPRMARKNDIAEQDNVTMRKNRTGTNALKIDLLPGTGGNGLNIPT
jgi:hypothetical protein